jgi:hypothetical protein
MPVIDLKDQFVCLGGHGSGLSGSVEGLNSEFTRDRHQFRLATFKDEGVRQEAVNLLQHQMGGGKESVASPIQGSSVDVASGSKEFSVSFEGQATDVPHDEVVQDQNNIQIYHQDSRLTAGEVALILTAKRRQGGDAGLDRVKFSSDRYIVAGHCYQFLEIQSSGGDSQKLALLDRPRKRRLYYISFPKLDERRARGKDKGKGGEDAPTQHLMGSGQFKQIIKEILSVAIRAAEANNEAFSLPMPNAYFRGPHINYYRELFCNAIVELSNELEISAGFKGLFLHLPRPNPDLDPVKNCPDLTEKFSGVNQNFPLVLAPYDTDTASVQAIAETHCGGLVIADAIMGNRTGVLGGGAFDLHGGSGGKEEATARLSAGYFFLIFGAGFNQRLLDQRRMVALTCPDPVAVSASAPPPSPLATASIYGRRGGERDASPPDRDTCVQRMGCSVM